MRPDEMFSEDTAVYDNDVNALETGSVTALRDYARELSAQMRRGVQTHEVLGTVLLLRDVALVERLDEADAVGGEVKRVPRHGRRPA